LSGGGARGTNIVGHRRTYGWCGRRDARHRWGGCQGRLRSLEGADSPPLRREPGSSAALDLSECQPAAPPGELARYLWEVGAETDEELIAAAQAVLRLVDPAGARSGKYEVTISGGKGIVVGDQANVTMTFNDGD
jgi:hypothetical protein